MQARQLLSVPTPAVARRRPDRAPLSSSRRTATPPSLLVRNALLLSSLIEPQIVHVFVAEPDRSIAQAVAALAVEVLPAEAETVIAKCTTVDGAKRLLERVNADPRSLVIVVCASDFPGGASGLDVLAHARAKHPSARVVLMTNGERDAFVTALAQELDALITNPDPLAPLRSILNYLGQGATARSPREAAEAAAEPTERSQFQIAVLAMGAALEAVERARDALARSEDDAARAARTSLRDAEVLAIAAHRRMLDAERKLRAQQA